MQIEVETRSSVAWESDQGGMGRFQVLEASVQGQACHTSAVVLEASRPLRCTLHTTACTNQPTARKYLFWQSYQSDTRDNKQNEKPVISFSTRAIKDNNVIAVASVYQMCDQFTAVPMQVNRVRTYCSLGHPKVRIKPQLRKLHHHVDTFVSCYYLKYCIGPLK